MIVIVMPEGALVDTSPAKPSFGKTLTVQLLSVKTTEYNSIVSVRPKEGLACSIQTVLWYDISRHPGLCFCMAHIIFFLFLHLGRSSDGEDRSVRLDLGLVE